MPSLSFPIIDPIAFSIGPFAIRWYALAYVTGLLGGWFYAKRLAARADLWIPQRQPRPVDIDDLIVWVALGVVLGGRLYRGTHGFGGEFGHVSVDPGGRRCACGSRGCVETFVGQEAIAAAAGIPPSGESRGLTDELVRRYRFQPHACLQQAPRALVADAAG